MLTRYTVGRVLWEELNTAEQVDKLETKSLKNAKAAEGQPNQIDMASRRKDTAQFKSKTARSLSPE